jgi:enoyl-CoA hydratase/carnithine racemase
MRDIIEQTVEDSEAILSLGKKNRIPLSYRIARKRQRLDRIFVTEDAKEGMQAFTEKRDPNFKDR